MNELDASLSMKAVYISISYVYPLYFLCLQDKLEMHVTLLSFFSLFRAYPL